LAVVVPSSPADAGGLMLAALEYDGPVIFMEHKLLSESWLEFMGSGGRSTVEYDLPQAGRRGPVPSKWLPIRLGSAQSVKAGTDLTIISVGVGVHRALEAAETLSGEDISAGVVDLRSISPLDKETVIKVVSQTGNLLVVDEDYERFGLSGELAALVLEAGLKLNYGRVCTQTTIPYNRSLEDQTLPNVTRICAAARSLLKV
jgi:pyruvate dehydrogenase E1 component beta subunit